MTIAAAEDWLKVFCEDVLGSTVTVTTGPHEWDGSFLKSLLTQLPAVVITWDGGTAVDSTSVTLDATWTLYVLTGWKGGDQVSRRRQATTGAYAILTALAVRLHNANMGQVNYAADGSGSPIAGLPPLEDLDGFGRLSVADITNEGSGEWSERIGVAIYALELEQNMPLELPENVNLDDWLRTNATFDIPEGDEFDIVNDEIGVDGDVTSRFDQPQS